MKVDPYRKVAAIVFNVPEAEVTDEQRSRVKTMTYAAVYDQAMRPGYPIRNLGAYFTEREESPSYRAAMTDAGRGHLLK